MIGNIDEIIGVNGGKKENEDGLKTPGKTSIMTTSTGKTLKRKHEDDAIKNDADEVCIIPDDTIPEKKLAMESLESKSEITITPIPKTMEEKSKNIGTVA